MPDPTLGISMKKLTILSLAAFLLLSCAAQKFPDNPKLVVMIAVDMFPAEVLQRIEPHLKGGLKWLLNHGIHYENAHQEHANTVTGTGHFAIGSGRYPGPSGVLGNSWYVRSLGKSVNCVEDSIAKPVGGKGNARSYRQIESNTVSDWAKSKHPDSKVYTVAAKDRAAILLGGENANLAIYYNYNGTFITSDYYMEKLPGWLDDFNQSLNIYAYRDSVWNHSRKMELYHELATVDSFYGEVDEFNDDIYSPTLPKSLNSVALEKTGDYLVSMPWFDRIVMKIAESAIINEELGKDEIVDFLGIGFSTADWIGHNHGPNSHEVLDYFFRFDAYLMNFIKTLDDLVGLEDVFFVLSSDHGVIPLPEYLSSNGIESERLDHDGFNSRIKRIKEQLGDDIIYSGNGFYFPRHFTDDQKEDALQLIKKEMIGLNALGYIFSREEILLMKEINPFNRRLKHMIHPQMSPDVILVLREYFTSRAPLGTTHGTPYNYDTHVPLIFSHINIKPARISRPVATVDIAPTIGSLLNVSIPEDVDGNSLQEVSP